MTNEAAVEVGQLLVHGWKRSGCRITEPLTGACVARGFPTELQAVAAARELDNLADWYGVIKCIAAGIRPNCQAEIARIAEAHGGVIADGSTGASREKAAAVVRSREGAAG